MRRFLLSHLRQSAGETGQMLVLFALGLVVFCGAVALSIDVGAIVTTRTDLQRSADAAALAGAQSLPNHALATSFANSYAGSNTNEQGSNTTTAAVTIAQDSSWITVEVSRPVPFTFGRVLGLTSKTVTARATARALNYIGGNGIMPFGFVANSTNPCFQGMTGPKPNFTVGQLCTLKDGAPGTGGDFGVMQLDGSGESNYEDDVINGSSKYFKIGDKLDPQTGVLGINTFKAVDDRLALGSAYPQCDTWGEAVTENADGTVSIADGCENSPFIGIIPVVDKIDHNGDQSTILGWSFFYLESVTKTNGAQAVGKMEWKARFMYVTTQLPGGIYSGTTETGATAIALSE